MLDKKQIEEIAIKKMTHTMEKPLLETVLSYEIEKILRKNLSKEVLS